MNQMDNPKNNPENRPENKPDGKKHKVELSKSTEELAKEAKVTKEDMEALGPKDLSMDMDEDEQLKQRVDDVDFEGSGLDVPGREMDDDREDIGAEDEENNLYSLGSDDNDDLERGEP